MNNIDYWKECVAVAAEECGLSMTDEQLNYLSGSVKCGHEEYGMAFYSPPPSDRLNEIKRQYKDTLRKLEENCDRYKRAAETSVKIALGLNMGSSVSIHEDGQVLVHGGHTRRVQ